MAPTQQTSDVPSATGKPGVETIVAAVDLLSHFWSRPVADEVASWTAARDLEAETDSRISSDPLREPVRVPDLEEVPRLLDEYERLFVGPGQVPCPPYESFWREDVSVDIRRTLMGPCTAELKQIYSDLALQMSAQSVELPDHIAIELEAMAYALSFEETAPVARRIFEEHLARWLPRLCRAVAHEAAEAFYRDLAVLTLDWLAAIKGHFALAESG
jgi:TorA maturation chaperone TorD